MKVAIYSGAIPSTTFIENLINAVAGNGTRVHLFGTSNARVKYKFANVYQYLTPSSSWKRFLFTLIQLGRATIFHPKRLRKLIEQLDRNWGWREIINYLSKTLPVINHLPDIFHIQWAHAVEDWIWLQKIGVKVVCSLRGGQINYSPICNPEIADRYRKYFPKIDAFHAVSNAIAKEAQKYGADPEKIKVIYSGVDLKKIEKVKREVSSIRQKTKSSNNQRLNESTLLRPSGFGGQANQPASPCHAGRQAAGRRLNIISVGRFHWKKGYTYSIDACKILKDKEIDFKYTIIASGFSQEYVYQIEDLGLNNYIEIISGLPHKETLRQIALSDVLLLPSIEEGIANVVLEAMALGTPVISTNCGGMGEVIEKENNGFLVKYFDSFTIANRIEKVSKLSTKELHFVTEKAKVKVYSDFNLDGLAKGMFSLYTSII